MSKLIRNQWLRARGEPFERARILSHDSGPEGFDVERIRCVEAGRLELSCRVGHIVSVVRGRLQIGAGGHDHPLALPAGVHAYLPPGLARPIEADRETELVLVTASAPEQARGRRLLIRNECFLAACAAGDHALRWILTPQYLSRRIFLHHDEVLLSKAGQPVSWFRTTMFDVSGLPRNEDGESVFKMSYNSRTEFNVCYEVEGTARVRLAQHPYSAVGQRWSPWWTLDGDSTYHLNEARGGPEEERIVHPSSKVESFLRNKHEVAIDGGHVSLFCLFDPAPTGIERHRPGEYSDYEPIDEVLARPEYERHMRELRRFDQMVDRLSMAAAGGALDAERADPIWEMYLGGCSAQAAIEKKLCAALAADAGGRDAVIARWISGL